EATNLHFSKVRVRILANSEIAESQVNVRKIPKKSGLFSCKVPGMSEVCEVKLVFLQSVGSLRIFLQSAKKLLVSCKELVFL
ncbi:11134_t:CDS:2, partial [Ambispora leptoticha]